MFSFERERSLQILISTQREDFYSQIYIYVSAGIPAKVKCSF